MLQIRSILLLSFVCSLLQAETADAQGQIVQYVTRAEAATFLLRNKEPPVPDALNNGRYPDVIENEWYTKYVLAALGMRMWRPDPFSQRALPHQPITREEYITMMALLFDVPMGGPYAYTDISVGHPLEAIAGLAARYKLFFDPQDPYRLRPYLPVTHKEASTMYYTLLANVHTANVGHRFMLQQTAQTPKHVQESNILRTYTSIVSRALVKSLLQKKYRLEPSTAERIQTQIVAATNTERQKVGVAPLAISKLLQASAAQHAKDMYERGYFSHFTPEGKSYVDRIKDSGYTDVDPVACGCEQVFNVHQTASQEQRQVGPNFMLYQADICSCTPKYALGENLAKGQFTVEEVVQDWMNSPGHRRNMLEPAFTELGVGIFRDLWVQNFGKFEY